MILRAVGGFERVLKLDLNIRQGVQIGLHLVRQLPRISDPVLLELLFLRHQALPRLLDLTLHELLGAVCEAFTVAQALVDVGRGQFVGHDGRHFGLRTPAEHLECVALDRHADVAAHLIDDVLHDTGAPLLRVQIELFDDALEPGSALHGRRNRVEPVVEALRDSRPDVVERHLLWHYLDQRFRLVAIGQLARDDGRGRRHDRQRDEDEPDPLAENLENVPSGVNFFPGSILSPCAVEERLPQIQ